MAMKWVILDVIGLIIGVGIACGAFLLLPRLALPYDSPIYQNLGIHKPEVIGFLPYWLQSKAKDNYNEEITILTYFGLMLDNKGQIQKMVNAKEEEPGWTTLKKEIVKTRLAEAKKHGQKLSLLLQMSGEKNIGTLIADPETNGHKIVSEVAPILAEYKFDDLNLDIESFAEASPAARAQFTELVITVANDLHSQKLATLTLDISPSAVVKPYLYDVPTLGQIADKIVLMAYDYHYTGSYVSGAVAPIGGKGTVSEFDVSTGITEAMKVIPREKIILGIPLYGYMWETINETPGSPVVPGSGVTMSGKSMAALLASCNNCTTGIDPVTEEPYVTYPSTDLGITKQIFYEDKSALNKKIELAKTNKLAGVAVWALGYEDESMLLPLSEYRKYYYQEPALPSFLNYRFPNN